MIFTTEMIQLFAVVLGRDCEPVTESLLREGVMQFINISELDGQESDSFSAVKSDVSLTDLSDLRKRVEGSHIGSSRTATAASSMERVLASWSSRESSTIGVKNSSTTSSQPRSIPVETIVRARISISSVVSATPSERS